MVNKNIYYARYRTGYFKATLQGIIRGCADPHSTYPGFLHQASYPVFTNAFPHINEFKMDSWGPIG